MRFVDLCYFYARAKKIGFFRKGVTLIEVLVASLILVIVVVSVMMMFANQNFLAESMKRENEAIMLIQSKLEMIKSNKDAVSLVSVLGTVTYDNPETFIINGINYKLYYSTQVVDYDGVVNGTTNPKLYEVKVLVSWNDTKGNAKTTSLVTRTNDY